jgi:hypothetical protein
VQYYILRSSEQAIINIRGVFKTRKEAYQVKVFLKFPPAICLFLRDIKALKVYRSKLIFMAFNKALSPVNSRPYSYKIEAKYTDHSNCRRCAKDREPIDFRYKSLLLFVVE